MLDLLFLKYETTVIATIIGVIVGVFTLVAVKKIYDTLSDKNPLKLIGKICYEISIDIGLISDWIRGFRYYEINDYPYPIDLKNGSVVKIDKQDFPKDAKILPSDNPIGNTAMILSIQCIHPDKGWALMRMHKYKA